MDTEKDIKDMIQSSDKLLSELPYRHVLINLFIHPRYGLFLALRGGWWIRGLLVLLLIGALGGALKALSVLPGLITDSREVVVFLADKLGEASFRNGKIQWSEPAQLPLSGHLSRLRVDVWAENSEKARQELLQGPAQSGIIVLPDRVEYWILPEVKSDSIHAVSILPQKMLDALEKNGQNGTFPSVFSKQQLLDYVQLVCLLLSPILALVYSLSMMGTILLFALFFSLLLQLRNNKGKFRYAAGMGLHCCVPPFMTSVVYHVFVPGLGRFENVFGIVFLLYILFMIIEDKWFRAEEKQLWGL
ncbi:MAG: hypothetical protein WCT05_07410 [Lentisphaeria bacterium]